MLKELNGKDAVVIFRLEFVVHDVACHDAEVLEAFGRGDGVNVLFLRARVGAAGYGAVGEDFGEVEGQGTPAAARILSVSTSLQRRELISHASWNVVNT